MIKAEKKTGVINSELRSMLLMLLAAAIWGFAFAAQSEAGKYLGPYTFNGSRFLLGGMTLLPAVMIKAKKTGVKPVKGDVKRGALVALVLFVSSTMQQFAIPLSGAGKSSFLTAMYVVLVPVGGLLLGRKTNKLTWLSLALTAPALYLLCIPGDSFSVAPTDLLLLASAIFWAAHILLVDTFVKRTDPMTLCLIQFFVCAALNLACAFIFEGINWQSIGYCALPILYVGVFSTGVAYTLQALGQQGAKPAHAALVLSMESVFGVLGGAIIQGEVMTLRGYLGCALMLCAVVLSQSGALREGKKRV